MAVKEQTTQRTRAGQPVPVTIAPGDGIGPEIMEATLAILGAAGAMIAPETIEVGEKLYRNGHTSGIAPEAWDSIRRTQILLKGPITTPQGGGMKSLNVTLRKSLGLYANVRPVRSYDPFVVTKHPHLDLTIIRENEEDLYAGIEHRQTDEVVQCLKLISRPGSERIMRYAFEFTRRRGLSRLTCFTKDNIMKLTDGLFHQVFNEVAEEYPDIQADHMIVDIGMARLADAPERFQVIVTPNLYGDILSDIAAEIAGSVGLAGSANIGEFGAMFEAVHGSAPDIAGKGIANPSGLLQAAIKMLAHIGQGDTATLIQNAWLSTIEDGVHTGDIYTAERSKLLANTQAFTDAVIERLGEHPKLLRPITYLSEPIETGIFTPVKPAVKDLVGVDVFLHWAVRSPQELGRLLSSVNTDDLRLSMITNRGVKVWPEGFEETFCTDHWRCRFEKVNGEPLAHRQVIDLLGRIDAAGFDFIKTEHLYNFDGKPGYSLGQGQ